METMVTSSELTSVQALRLQNWFSPAFPIGSFSYSHSLEMVIDNGVITELDDLVQWIEDTLEFGSARTDAILFAEAWHSVSDVFDESRFVEVTEIGAAMRNTSELALESTAQGASFISIISSLTIGVKIEAVKATLENSGIRPAIPIVSGATCAAHNLPLEPSLIAYLNSFCAMLIAAATKLIPLGQTDAQRATLSVEKAVLATARRALKLKLEDIGGATAMTDIYSMRHETQYSRMFRS